MYTTSALYDTLIAQTNHYFETQVSVDGVVYGQDKLMSVNVAYTAFASEQPTVGGCLSGELYMSMLVPTSAIQRMAEVIPYVRVTDGTNYSEWIPQGVYYVDTRETTHNDDGLDILTLHCYDAMLMTEQEYPDSTMAFPATDVAVVQEIANTIGVSVDYRTWDVMTNSYPISAPLGYSMREVLGNIAAMYAGNFIMTYDGELRLVGLAELPEETNYLIDNSYDAITFGGDRILV